MSVFVDTGVFYALQNRRANRHDAAERAVSAVLGGRYGRPYTSDYVYDETVTLVRSRTGSYEQARIVGDRIRGTGDFPDAVELFHVDERVFEAAVAVFDRYDDHPISFTDATTVALVEDRDLDAVLTFDDDFEGLVDRLNPTDVEA